MLEKNGVNWKQAIYYGLVALLGFVGTCALITAKHGFSAWGQLVHALWPILGIAISVGCILGSIEAKLLRNFLFGGVLVAIVHIATAIPLAITLSKRPEFIDNWLLVLIAIAQLGAHFIIRSLLTLQQVERPLH